jgi:hypothetical protein
LLQHSVYEKVSNLETTHPYDYLQVDRMRSKDFSVL